uniref:Coatomer subunit delta n=1 Tax=Haptolina ericina TaxID=156174 RepID=A0A7S3AEA8_9EUKA|mmetsp:Transcript_14543/g.32641  ORF Transcript_14543/g.32641 Transcript_14543/m.32641 type:complete len:321 (+) Transcript_14543:2-964(+)
MAGGGSGSFGMPPTPTAAPMLKPKKGEGGMQLGKPKGALGGASLLQAMVDDGEVLPSKAAGVPEPSPTSAGASAMGKSAPITLTCDEKLVISLKRDGGLDSMEVKGDLQLLVTDASYGKALLPLKLGANPGFQFKTHPNINKQLFASSSQIGLKDPARPFPTGQSLGVVKWRLQTTDESMVPLLVTCWPSQTAPDAWDVTLEYELTKQLELHDMLVSIPIPPEVSHTISNAEVGQATYSRREGALQWSVPLVDSSNASATIEFSVSGAPSADAIFPISISFSSRKTLCEMAVDEVLSAEDNSQLPFSLTTMLTVESYTIS